VEPTDIRSLRDLVTYLQSRTQDKWDALVLITGEPGVGKSNCANFLAHLGDDTFTLARTAFSGGAYVRLCERSPPNSWVVWDEIVQGGIKVEATTREGKSVRKHLMTGRSLRQVSLACAPTRDDFLSYATEDRARWWIWVYARGRAKVHYYTDKSPYASGSATRWTEPLFRFKFPQMADAEMAEYERLKEEWRVRWGRDSDALLKHAAKRDRESEAVTATVKRLGWLPDAVQAYAQTFPGHGGKLKPWEKKLRPLITGSSALEATPDE